MNRPMRRNDREVTDSVEIERIMTTCTCCRIGFQDEDMVYIVPLNFGFVNKNDSYTLYFHGAKSGHKIDLLASNPKVGFEMDTGYRLNTAEVACGYSTRFESIIGNGIACMVTDLDEKRIGLTEIMKHNTGQANWNFTDAQIQAVSVFKIKVDTLSSKAHD